ncbi:WxL domain-containing protein [Vagococcus fluvialis]|uniref:WxL domain-containing protein n=1 Tax=Vagococcus fluvialis TaxID=2738 RepID=A0A7X6D9T0_9ENTE|nr:WxL domain-containing protein [Vagococcus fluvialis]NKC68419.1 WxL domain-containing protein [Vagococcus fluvialis]
MKAKTLCAAVLSTLILGGTVASAAEAPTHPMTTNGHVTVENGKVDPEPGVTDPEKPDEKLPDLPDVKPNPTDPENMGPLEISHAPVLQFGTVQTDTKDVTKYAAANKFKNAAGEDQTRGAILQFGDLRTDANGYTVNAKMTKQFTQTTGTGELTGSTITFTNPFSATADGSTGTTPGFETKVELAYNESALVATAENADKAGKGMWAVEYGSSKNVNAEDTTESSVELLIPANTASSMAGGAYVSDIEWSITAAPQD